MPKFKPCPQCGNKEPELVDHKNSWTVECKCGSVVRGMYVPDAVLDSTDKEEMRQSAIDWWNNAISTEEAAELKLLT